MEEKTRQYTPMPPDLPRSLQAGDALGCLERGGVLVSPQELGNTRWGDADCWLTPTDTVSCCGATGATKGQGVWQRQRAPYRRLHPPRRAPLTGKPLGLDRSQAEGKEKEGRT